MFNYCCRSKHQPDWDPWRRSLHSPHRRLHHLHQVLLHHLDHHANDDDEDDCHHHCPHFYHHHPQQDHHNDIRRRKRWSGSVRDAESDGDLLAAHLHQVPICKSLSASNWKWNVKCSGQFIWNLYQLQQLRSSHHLLGAREAPPDYTTVIIIIIKK